MHFSCQLANDLYEVVNKVQERCYRKPTIQNILQALSTIINAFKANTRDLNSNSLQELYDDITTRITKFERENKSVSHSIEVDSEHK